MAKERMEKNIEILKKDYEKIRNKYNLPSFKFMNENFEIEDIDAKETELLIKKIRNRVREKTSAILRVLEAFLNPANTQIFMFEIINCLNKEDKQLINSLYKRFTRFEIEAFGLELEYNEKKEAEFIEKICKEWDELIHLLKKIENSIKTNFNKEMKKSEKSYFG